MILAQRFNHVASKNILRGDTNQKKKKKSQEQTAPTAKYKTSTFNVQVKNLY